MLSGISLWQLAIVLLIVILVFGTQRLKTLGKDVGSAVKGFKQALHDDSESTDRQASAPAQRDATDTSTPAGPAQHKD